MTLKKAIVSCALLCCWISSGAVSLQVKVPAGTQACYVSGKFNNWSAENASRLVADGDGRFTIDLPDVSSAQLCEGYKYLSGPDWKYVEKDASGGEIGNRTSIGSPDVVGSWAASYNPDIVSTTVTIDGYDRLVRVCLPPDYASSGKSYPVVYLEGVQQRYSAAGSDDAGDDFFDADSWNAQAASAALQDAGLDGCIIVGMYGFVAENLPYAHADFAGSGASPEFLSEYIDKVVGYVNSNFRTETAPEYTTIAGADMGGLFSLYAAASRPDVFGYCLSVSPLLWLYDEELTSLVTSVGTGRYILAYGSEEPTSITAPVSDLADALGARASLIRLDGAIHDDTSWGIAFPTLLRAVYDGGMQVPQNIEVRKLSPIASRKAAADFASSQYTFYYKAGSESVAADSSVAFAFKDDFVLSNGSTVKAQVAVKDISKSVTNTVVYWNVGRKDEDGSTVFLSDSPKNVSFSSKKTNSSWLRVAVREGETIDSKAVSSAGFRVVTNEATTAMTAHSNHRADATVEFLSDDKNFTIHYGSVNTETDMGAITATYAVSESCIEATINYYFETNTVEITETKWGQSFGKVSLEEFSAVPSVTTAGNSSVVTVRFSEGAGCTPALRMGYNYASRQPASLTHVGDDTWQMTISDLQPGIYRLTVDATLGSAVKEDMGEIWIKVLSKASDSSAAPSEKLVSINAYEGIDWASTGRYKANLHTHTSQSFDTKFHTDYVVDAYAAAGYSVLGLTDHDANPYPWQLFDVYNPASSPRDPADLGILAIPAVELSKDNRNNWNEAAGGEFNHHNDFFTGRKGQEFASLRESYAYTERIGGLQLINHPGQYWNLATDYTPGVKNSPEWHAENFKLFSCLFGLEVYNQGNRRPNDRILWDQILELTMPARPVWGYSNDDTHTAEQYFRNYQFMLMPELTVDALKTAMKGGHTYFCYEYTGSGEAKAPRIAAIDVDNAAHTISIDTDADPSRIYWIYSTDKPSSGSASSRKSTVIGMGPVFHFEGYRGSYVRALIKNDFGETCTQPFGFEDKPISSISATAAPVSALSVSPNPASNIATVTAPAVIDRLEVYSAAGAMVICDAPAADSVSLNVSTLNPGVYLLHAFVGSSVYSHKLIVK